MVSYARQPTRVRLGEQSIRIDGVGLTLVLDPSIEPKVLSHYICKWLSEKDISDYHLGEEGYLYRNKLPLDLKYSVGRFCINSKIYFTDDTDLQRIDIIIRLLLALAEYQAVEE